MTQDINYMKLYAENDDFRRYVDRYGKQYVVLPHEAVQHVIVQAYGDQLVKRQSEIAEPVKTEINIGCGGGC